MSNGIRFSSLDSWPDKGESRFYNADYRSIKPEFVRPRVFATCFTRNKQSEASWKGYIDLCKLYENRKQWLSDNLEDSLTVAQLKINRTALKKELSQYVRDNNDSVLGIYEGEVCYVSSYALLNCHLPGIPGAQSLHNALFEKGAFGIDDYLSVCLMKRMEIFEQEKEIRYFLVTKEIEKRAYTVKVNVRGVIEQMLLWKPFSSSIISEQECLLKAEEFGLDREIVKPADIYMNNNDNPISIQTL